MSGRNYTVCPQCRLNSEAARAAAERRCFEEAYGKVEPAEYERLRREAMNIDKPEDTMREDYEMRMTVGGVFRWYYCASCSECGFEFNKPQTSEQVPLEQPPG